MEFCEWEVREFIEVVSNDVFGVSFFFDFFLSFTTVFLFFLFLSWSALLL